MTATMPQTGSRRLSTAKAMVEAISQEMERDESVFVLGEDVGAYGGIFSSTTGLLETFGPTRVLDTPISETAFIGLAIGAAVEGMRPIAELMFVDPPWPDFDRRTRWAACTSYAQRNRRFGAAGAVQPATTGSSADLAR